MFLIAALIIIYGSVVCNPVIIAAGLVLAIVSMHGSGTVTGGSIGDTALNLVVRGVFTAAWIPLKAMGMILTPEASTIGKMVHSSNWIQ